MTGLVPFGVLVSTVYAIRGATSVGDLVLEAPEDPVDIVNRTEGTKPVIAVYVGIEDHKLHGKELLQGTRRLEVAIQVYLPESTRVVVDGRTIALDTRGLGAEVLFASLMRQIYRALQCQTTPWSRCWNSFVQNVPEVMTQPFLWELPGKTRGFAREVTLICDTADEPRYGDAPYPFWADFIDGLGALDDYGPDVAALIAAEIQAPPDVPSWSLAAASEGDDPLLAGALGFGPYDPTPAGQPPAITGEPAALQTVADDGVFQIGPVDDTPPP